MFCSSAEDELHLAAQLGRSLLDKNEELRKTVADQRHLISDKDLEISFLRKQVERLRDLNESRMKQLEQFDAAVKDLEVNKSTLSQECGEQKVLIQRLKESLQEVLENQKVSDTQVDANQHSQQMCQCGNQRAEQVEETVDDSNINDIEQMGFKALRLDRDLQRLKRDFVKDSQVILDQLETYRFELGQVCRWLAEDFLSWAKVYERERLGRSDVVSVEEEKIGADHSSVSIYAELKMTTTDSGSGNDCCVGICRETNAVGTTDGDTQCPSQYSSEPPNSDYRKIFEEIYCLLRKFNITSVDHKRSQEVL